MASWLEWCQEELWRKEYGTEGSSSWYPSWYGSSHFKWSESTISNSQIERICDLWLTFFMHNLLVTFLILLDRFIRDNSYWQLTHPLCGHLDGHIKRLFSSFQHLKHILRIFSISISKIALFINLIYTGVHALPMTEDLFDSWLIAHHYTFVNYYAPWCVWCQRLEPVWEAFAEMAENEGLAVSVVKIDCMANQNLCMAQKIQV